jgi:flagellar basal-body rod protein FlgB
MRIASFADTYRTSSEGVVPLRSRAGHLAGLTQTGSAARQTYAATEPSPNGNTVSLEEEMLQSAEVQREHDRALAIYKHGLTILRTVLAR